MMHKLLKILSPVLKALLKWYLRKPRTFSFKDIHVVVDPGVFYPRFILSTKLLLEFLDERDLTGKKFLELGAGCGIISLLAARKGALVTASDINPAAVANSNKNALLNHLELNIVQSDLFDNIAEKNFDMVVIAPPYYPKEPKDFSEMAWYCGKDFDYFVKLFPQLSLNTAPTSEIIMILSEDCNISKIKEIASRSEFEFQLLQEVKRMGERNFIFRIHKK